MTSIMGSPPAVAVPSGSDSGSGSAAPLHEGGVCRYKEVWHDDVEDVRISTIKLNASEPGVHRTPGCFQSLCN